MTTLAASVPTFRDGVQGGQRLPLADDADVTRLAELLAEPWADTASIQSEDAALNVHVQDGWGYLLYAGDAGYLMTDGDPASPAAPCEMDFPAGSGLPAERVIAAVREFVRTRKLPKTVPWRDA
ncbi:Imm1 family immunity protein [Amycolatopsis panacis]|nr:Imm1 family immunity protein [Amycolatopsis panacis]